MKSDVCRRRDHTDRRNFIGGSDARIIMGQDERALIRLWKEKRGLASTGRDQSSEPADVSVEQRPRRRRINIVSSSRPRAEFGDEDLQFFFRQVQQIALGQIGAGALEFSIFGEKPPHPLHHFRLRLDHAQLPSGRPAAITGRRPPSA
jgi:hypothetical protein